MTRRMTLLVLAIVGLMVLVVTVSPPRTAQRGTAGPSSTPGALLSDPDEFDVTATLSADGDASPQTIEATLGDDVEIVVEGEGPGRVALTGLQSDVFETGLPARFTLMAETPGTYPLLVDDERQIGTLTIR
ncbi:hypothetical protein DVA67_011530 [Solirubrobacter sp. CPCC 204708]|uniref:EfeO-type cupredoxin-like domain-containing protein n=1 Tax=Solirubrobacter deserti TaxID=2282478 RepID=A0ABT4RPL8_9ACTN|nr:hypothetical protein [Solirubrobacter deserti]MBE2316610.1 hypothetical protein [Solirubrobacter deserti]MDA0140508.1 hypothetical protein [Solirubrobacter deserti]